MAYHSLTQRIGLASSALSIPEDHPTTNVRELKASGGGYIGFARMSRREKLTFINFCATNLCAGCFYSLLGPFFPTEVDSIRCIRVCWFFCTKRDGDIPTGTPVTGASNAGVVGKKRDSGRISGFAAYMSIVLSTVRVANCEKQLRRTAASVEHTAASVVRCSHKTTTKCL